MVISSVVQKTPRGARASLIIELIVATAIFTGAMLPLSFSILREQKLLRACYYRSIAIEIVDGELEVLRAGEWRAFHQGQQPYSVHAQAASNLPPGKFQLTLLDKRLRLEWKPDKNNRAPRVAREIQIQ